MASVRPAIYQDIPRLCELLKEGHADSKYAQYRLDIKNRFKPFVMESVRSGDHCVFVSETNGQVEGYLIGMVDDLYQFLAVQYATDVLFWVSKRDDKRNFIRLLDAFREWAASHPKVVRIRYGVTDVVGDTGPVERLYERKGLRREGALFEEEIVR